MPEGFDNCEKKGGHVRRKKVGKNKYINICWLNGKSYAGEVHTKKK